MSFISIVAPQRTWSPTQPPWRSATQRWDAISRSLPTPTTLPTMNYRHDTRRTCMKLWARCRRFITDWRLARDTRTRLLPQTKTAIRLCPCSKVAVNDALLNMKHQLLVTCSHFTVHLAGALLHIVKTMPYLSEQFICTNQPKYFIFRNWSCGIKKNVTFFPPHFLVWKSVRKTKSLFENTNWVYLCWDGLKYIIKWIQSGVQVL